MTVLISVMIVSGFVFLLCCIILLSGKLFEQSGEVELRINSSETFSMKRGQKLLSALSECGVHLPASCGGKGNCGRCKVKILSGGGPVTSIEKIVLNPDELAQNQRLACQVKLREKMDLKVDEKLLAVKLFKARVIEAKTVADKIRTLLFKLEDGQNLDFKAGQYVQVSLDLPWEKVVRAYSVSSSPNVKGEFSLDIQLIDGGIMSSRLHQIDVGATLEFTGPYGDMAIEDSLSDKDIVLVAGGVGLAPMRSIVSFLIEKGYKNRIWLFHGVRNGKNLYSADEFKVLAKEHKNFRYIPVLSEPLLEDGWTGDTGLVTESLQTELAKEGCLNAEAYLCGPLAMMETATSVLVKLGLTSDKIHSDPFNF